MYKIHISEVALTDIAKIGDYIENQLDNQKAASLLYEEIRSMILSLTDFPNRFAEVVVGKLCFHRVSVKNFNIYYCVDIKSQTVTIARVLYSGMDINLVAIN